MVIIRTTFPHYKYMGIFYAQGHKTQSLQLDSAQNRTYTAVL